MQCGVAAAAVEAMTIGGRHGGQDGKEGRGKGVSSRQLINECAVKKPFLAATASAAVGSLRVRGILGIRRNQNDF